MTRKYFPFEKENINTMDFSKRIISFRGTEVEIDHELYQKILGYPQKTLISRKFLEKGSIHLERDVASWDKIKRIYLGEDVFDVLAENYFIDDIEFLYKDLLFYEFLPIKNEPDFKLKDIIDLNFFNHTEQRKKEAIERIKQKLPSCFIENLTRYDGIIAGSLPLQCYLNEEWEGSDVDIYIHHANFILRSDSDIAIQKQDRNTWGDVNIERPLEISHINKSQLIRIIGKIFGLYQKEALKNINNFHVKYSGSNPYFVLDDDDDRIETPIYRYSVEIKYIFKFEINSVKYDIVLTSTTPRHFIRLFDFEFNQIYYDGYVLNAFNWDSIHNRFSKNWYDCQYGEYQGYKENIERIKKYTRRGFTIIP